MNLLKQIRRFFPVVLAVSLFALSSCTGTGHQDRCQIIPQPKTFEEGYGHFTFTKGTLFQVSSAFDASAMDVVKLFSRELNCASGLATIVEQIPQDATSFKAGVSVLNDSNLVNEAYELNVTKNMITIKASGREGIFYALQSLKQMLPVEAFGKQVAENVSWTVESCKITDAPRFGYRGVMLDVARHFFPKEEVMKLIDVMAMQKQNVLHWHLTDDQGWRIEIKKYPKLTEVGCIRLKTMIRKEWDNYDNTPYGGFYTQEDIREVVKYAQDRCITIVPEIDLPGHMMAALAAYPELGCTGGPYAVSGQWGIRDDVLCPGKESTFDFIEGVLTEVMALFPSEYIHIGGDECPKVRWEKCPLCQARIKREGIKGNDKHGKEFFLQSYVTARVEKFLNANGRRLIGWDEILEGELAPDATVMSWRGIDGGIEAARMHHQVVMTPNSHVYLDHYQSIEIDKEPLAIGGYNSVERVYSLEPAPSVLTEEERGYILGVQGNLWTEYITTNDYLEYMLFPRVAALSEVAWTQPANKNYDNFRHRLGHLVTIYDQMGVNYAKHVFELDAKYDVVGNDGAVQVTLATLGDAPIYYTLDGTDPTTASTRYTAPVQVTESCVLKAIVDRPNIKTAMLEKAFTFNKATGHLVTLNTKPTEKYTFSGASLLTNGLRGAFNYSSGYWLGFLNEPMDITIHFQQPTKVSKVTLGIMAQYGEYVFPPKSISVYTAAKAGDELKLQGSNVMKETTKDSKDGLEEHSCSFPEVEAVEMRVVAETVSCIPQWHGARGEKGHLFVDEVIVE